MTALPGFDSTNPELLQVDQSGPSGNGGLTPVGRTRTAWDEGTPPQSFGPRRGSGDLCSVVGGGQMCPMRRRIFRSPPSFDV